jgi:hypothetical protein
MVACSMLVFQLQLLEREGGCLEQALCKWSSQASADALGRARERRAAANEAHAAVDALEEALQRERASTLLLVGAQTDGDAAVDAAMQPSVSCVRRELEAMSARLDATRASDGLPEDRVALTVFKAARAKLERLLALASGNGSTHSTLAEE